MHSALLLAYALLACALAQDMLGPRRRLVRRRKNLPSAGGQEGGLGGGNTLDPEGRLIRQKIKRKVKRPSSGPGTARPIGPGPGPAWPIGPVSSFQGDNTTVPAHPDQAKRFLSLFTIVSFKNDACASLTGNNGTCFSSKDCVKQGGTRSGTCASGFGVCCLFTKTCGGVTAVNGTFFQSSGYPSTFDSVGSCQLTINKASADVCQLRLDIDDMVLAQPEATDHKCDFDQFIVTGGSPLPAICGTNTGAHMYVDMGLSSNSPVVLTVVTAGQSYSRSFSIKVTQIECDSLSKASNGCLQYFAGVSGQMFSFNYNGGTGLQLSNTDYSMCVRMERNFCGIEYTACPDTVNPSPQSFSVSGSSNTGSQVGTGCSTDWLTIPCATNTNDPFAQNGTPVVCVDRLCGMVFNSAQTSSGSPNVPVYSFAKPFSIYVHTDSLEGSSSPPESLNRGFCLNYVQQPCTSSSG